MKYIEELSSGDTFSVNDKVYLLTCDFKSNGSKLCYSLSDGLPSWLSGQTVVEDTQLYTLDKENNVIPIKHVFAQATNIR